MNGDYVIGWGDNSTGQIDIPASATNVVAITTGSLHSVALLSDGTVLAWGDNSDGQTNVPASLNNAVAVAAGAFHSLAITRDAAIVGWGLNSNNQTVATDDLRAIDLSSNITESTVGNTNGLGRFTITYSVVGAQSATSSVTRTVVTVDTTRPFPILRPYPISPTPAPSP